jgi:hypothetical protein
MTKKLAVIFFGLSVLGITLPLSADDGTRQPVQVTSTERINFAPGGTIRLNDSYGYLTVEGWDQPDVEITVTKATDDDYETAQREQAEQRLKDVRVTVERRSDAELTISTILPSRRGFFPPLVSRKSRNDVTLDYVIRAPRDSQLVIHHDTGYVLVSNMTGDIEAANGRGDIVLMLPDSGLYSIDAKSKIGNISSDFAGATHRQHLIGQRFAGSSPPPSHRISLRVGFGGITIKEVRPATESPVAASTK